MHDWQDLIVSHSWLVRFVARSEFARVPPAVMDVDDLISIGTIGLIKAAHKYEAALSPSFVSYARYRIRGEIRDELRRVDIVSRTERFSRARLLRAQERLEQRLQRFPDEIELARELGVTLRNVQAQRNRSILLAKREPPDRLRASTNWDPGKPVLRRELREKIQQALLELSKRDREIIVMYHMRDMTMREIGESMRVRESRISQLHSRALHQLGIKLGSFRPPTKAAAEPPAEVPIVDQQLSTTSKRKVCPRRARRMAAAAPG